MGPPYTTASCLGKAEICPWIELGPGQRKWRYYAVDVLQLHAAAALVARSLSTAEKSDVKLFHRLARLHSSIFTARDSIVFSIVAKFTFSVNTITHEPLHLGWWSFARTCTLTTPKTPANIKVTVKGQCHKNEVCDFSPLWDIPKSLWKVKVKLGYIIVRSKA